jgi:formylmethanofuran dehydrogenase subunit E-like metal-binding protein
MSIPYHIGRQYKYPNSPNVFTLKAVRGYIFKFECGHWCTDNVFIDLIDITTGKQIYKTMPARQLTLF